MAEDIIGHYLDMGLIDEEIIFFIGSLELKTQKDGEVLLGSSLNPFERLNAIGLNKGIIKIFSTDFNHVKELLFEVPLSEVKRLEIVKKLFGKHVFILMTEDKYYEYKITANKDRAFNLIDKFNKKE